MLIIIINKIHTFNQRYYRISNNKKNGLKIENRKRTNIIYCVNNNFYFSIYIPNRSVNEFYFLNKIHIIQIYVN